MDLHERHISLVGDLIYKEVKNSNKIGQKFQQTLKYKESIIYIN